MNAAPTVCSLIMELLKYPLDAKVVMAKDGEGNGYSPLHMATNGYYFPENPWSGRFHEKGKAVGPDAGHQPTPGDVPAVCLWPVE